MTDQKQTPQASLKTPYLHAALKTVDLPAGPETEGLSIAEKVVSTTVSCC